MESWRILVENPEQHYVNTSGTDFPTPNQPFKIVDSRKIAYVTSAQGSMGAKDGVNFFKLSKSMMQALMSDIQSGLIEKYQASS